MKEIALALAALAAALPHTARACSEPAGAYCHFEYFPYDAVREYRYRTAGFSLGERIELWGIGIFVLNRPGMGGWYCLWWEDESEPLVHGDVCERNGENAVYWGQVPCGYESAVAVCMPYWNGGSERDVCFNNLFCLGFNWPVTLGGWKDDYDPSFIEIRFIAAHEFGHIWGLGHWSASEFAGPDFDPNYCTTMLTHEAWPFLEPPANSWNGNTVAAPIASMLHCGDCKLLEARLPCDRLVATEAFHSIRAGLVDGVVEVTLKLVREVSPVRILREEQGRDLREIMPAQELAGDGEGHLVLVYGDREVEPGHSYRYSFVGEGYASTPSGWVEVPFEKPELAVSAIPNPFSPVTTIRCAIARAGNVKLEVFNPLGQRVAVLADGFRPAGEMQLTWDGTTGGGAAASGPYFIRLATDSGSLTEKVVIAR